MVKGFGFVVAFVGRIQARLATAIKHNRLEGMTIIIVLKAMTLVLSIVVLISPITLIRKTRVLTTAMAITVQNDVDSDNNVQLMI